MNVTDMAMHPYCQEWNLTFDKTFHFGNIFLGSGYIVPQTFPISLFALRALITLGFGLHVFWALYSICGVDIFLYNMTYFVTNGIYFLHLASKHFPVFIPSQQREVYRKVFQTVQFSRKHFHLLMKEATVETVRAGKPFAVENETKVGNKLRILLSGKMAVKCDDLFLHFILPMEFVDSIEWRARDQSQPAQVFQVSIDAVYDSQILVMPSAHLEKLFADIPSIRFVLKCLLGKDITHKLYLMNEHVFRAASADQGGGRRRSGPSRLLDFHRTNSVDAISTGCRGFVRSKHWVNNSALKDDNDGEQLMVLNFELDVPPPLSYLPHNVPIHTVDRATMAEAQFIAQQRKYWPAGVL